MRFSSLGRGFAGLFLFLFTCFGCSPSPGLENMDTVSWKNDPKGCKGNRTSLVAQLEEARGQIYGWTNREIMQTLGRPDAEELREGSQRVFVYYTEPGTQCRERDKISPARKVYLRFNALNQVSELTYSHPFREMVQP